MAYTFISATPPMFKVEVRKTQRAAPLPLLLQRRTARTPPHRFIASPHAFCFAASSSSQGLGSAREIP